MDELASGEKIVGYASTPFEIAQVLAKRRYQLGLTGRCLDQVAGLADGHTTKLESAVKTLGQISLPTLLAALGCRLALVADDAAIPDRTREYMERLASRHMRMARRHVAASGLQMTSSIWPRDPPTVWPISREGAPLELEPRGWQGKIGGGFSSSYATRTSHPQKHPGQ